MKKLLIFVIEFVTNLEYYWMDNKTHPFPFW